MIFQQPGSSPASSSAGSANAAAPANTSLAATLKTKLRSRGMLILIAVVGLGAIGAKLFWPEPPKLKPAVAAAAKSGKPTAAGAAKKSTATASKSKSPAAPVTEKTTPKAAPAVAGKTAPKAPSTPKNAKTKPVETVIESPTATDTETASAPEEKPTPVAVAPAPAAKPTTAPFASATRRRAAAAAPAPAARPADPLGAIYIDETNGYSIRFPAGWSIRSFKGEPWVIDAGDGRVGLISIGFSPFPNGFTTESIPPEWIARRIKRRADTTLHGQGYSTIGGRKALWSKSTGPLPMTHANPRMTRVNYILPTGDGRVLELRVAASPEQFDRLVPVMKKAVETFKLLPVQGVDPVAAAGR